MDYCTTQPPNELGLACKTIGKQFGSMLILFISYGGYSEASLTVSPCISYEYFLVMQLAWSRDYCRLTTSSG